MSPPSSPVSPARLTARDLAILDMVHRYNLCTVQHLHQRFWSPCSSLSACYRRVSRLIAATYLSATRLPSPTGRGSGRMLISLGAAGRHLLAEQDEIPIRAIRKQTPRQSLLFVQHTLAVTDFHLALDLAVAATPDLSLLSWSSERELQATPITVPRTSPDEREGRNLTLIPDAAFCLRYCGVDQPGLLEMDMGTVAPRRLQLKLRGYLLHFSRIDTPVPVFFVTTMDRVAQILSGAQSEGVLVGGNPTLFFVTARDQVRAETILTLPIWQQPGVSGSCALLPPSRSPAGSITCRPYPPPHLHQP